jgi:hypothetical protein
VILWRAGLRIGEALDLAETDLDASRGAVLVRHGLCRIRHNPCYAEARVMPSTVTVRNVIPAQRGIGRLTARHNYGHASKGTTRSRGWYPSVGLMASARGMAWLGARTPAT